MALFLLGAAGFPLRHVTVFVVAVGVVFLVVPLAVARHHGPLYGVPLAIAAGLAFDSFYVPPVRALGTGAWQNTLMVAVFLLVGVAVGILGSRLQRRAEASEREHAALADEQTALRHVAALVARGPAPGELFAAVTAEVARILGIRDVTMFRFEDDGTATVVASACTEPGSFEVGARLPLGGHNVTTQVYRTGRAARIDHYADAGGDLGTQVKRLGVRSATASPIVVDGRLWGAMFTGSRRPTPLPPGVESRIGEFAALVATAISNVQTRSELAASRARVLMAADDERRRVVRDLHDGAQQRLVQTMLTLKLARHSGPDDLPALLDEALQHTEQATVELRELVHGILPSALAHGGLRAGVDALASRMPVPVHVAVAVDRLPPAVEATAYFVIAEALTNVAKHSHAEHAEVTARVEQHTLRLEVRDDGVGGAHRHPNGSGLVGLEDRLAVLDGRLRVETPEDGGTVVAAAIPLPDG
jgi:signal transduction histidine kinase